MTENPSPDVSTSSPKEYKLVIMGGGGVGKTSLIRRFIHGRFIDPEERDPAHEDHYRKEYSIDDETALLDITDTLQDEYFYGTIEEHRESGEGFLLVYSITSRNSFEQIKLLRKQILRTKNTASFPIILVANKCDSQYERQVGIKEGQNLAKEFDCVFLETSAKQDFNVEEVFYSIVREMRKYKKELHLDVPPQPENISHKATTTSCVSGCVMI